MATDFLGGPAAGDDSVDAVFYVLGDGPDAVVQIAYQDGQFQIAAPRGDIGHHVAHSFVGGDAKQTDFFHFQTPHKGEMSYFNTYIRKIKLKYEKYFHLYF